MSTCEGRAFHPSLPGGQQGGTLSVSFAGVRWSGEDGSVEMPLHGLGLEAGGANDRVLFFTHPAAPEWAITTTDWRALAEPALARHPVVSKLAAKAKRKRASGWWILGGVLGAIALALVGLFALRGPIVKGIASGVPPDVEVSLGQVAAEAIAAKSLVLEDAGAASDLEALTKPILASIGESRYEWRFRIVNDPAVNAFALPGGDVFVHSGLILRAERAEEVAGVLAHEIAHVQERHALRSIIERVGLATLASLLVGDSTGIQALLVSAAPELIGLKFSRDFEREADREGFRYLVKAGLDPTGMAGMFRKLQEEHEKSGAAVMDGATMSLLSTHPATDERFSALDRMASDLGETLPSGKMQVDFEAFQERIRGLATGGEP